MSEARGGAPGVVETSTGGLALLLVLLAGQLMANMDSAIVTVSAAAVRADLGATDGQLELVVAVYILAYALLLPVGARLGDLRGYRAAYFGGVLTFTAASLVCGLAPGPVTLILARAVQGVGAALMVPQILTGIQLAFTGEARTRALGLYAVTLSVGAVLGQVLGGLLVHLDLFGLGWRPAFLVNVPVGLALVVLGRRLLPPRDGAPARRLDRTGMLLLAGGMLLLLLPLVFGRGHGWPAWALWSLALSGPALVVFVLVERRIAARGGAPFVDLDVLRIPVVGRGLCAIAISHTTYAALLFTLPLHLQAGLGHSALWAGGSVAVWAATFGVAGVYWRRIPRRLWHLASPAGYGLLACAYVGTAAVVAAGGSGTAALAVLLGFGGLGLGLGYLPLVATFTGSVAGHQAAHLSGLVTTVLQLFGVIGVAGFGTLYFALLDARAAAPSPSGSAFTVVLLCFAAAAATATIAAVSARRPDHGKAGRP